MRRTLRQLWKRAQSAAGEVEASWDQFWFTPSDPTVLGFIRILTGLMLIYTHVVWGLQLDSFFGPNSWLTREVVETVQREQVAWSYWWYVPDSGIWPAHILALVVLTLFTLGLATRVTSILSFIIVVSYVNRVPCALFGLDQINGFLTLYCAIGPSGSALSLDRVIARYRAARTAIAAGQTEFSLPLTPSVGANVAIRLIQVQMCVIYFFAGITKLQGTAWWNGAAMWLAFSNYEYQSMDMTWLVGHFWLIELMTHTTIAWELTFWALIWRPLWRPFMLVLAVALHVGIGACLGMWTFGLIMLVGNVAFLKPGEISALLRSLFVLPRWPVISYDAGSQMTRRWASLRAAVNVFDTARLVPTAVEIPAGTPASPPSGTNRPSPSGPSPATA